METQDNFLSVYCVYAGLVSDKLMHLYIIIDDLNDLKTSIKDISDKKKLFHFSEEVFKKSVIGGVYPCRVLLEEGRIKYHKDDKPVRNWQNKEDKLQWQTLTDVFKLRKRVANSGKGNEFIAHLKPLKDMFWELSRSERAAMIANIIDYLHN